MTTKQLMMAVELAKSDIDLTHHDFSVFDGCGLKDFETVYVTLESVARLIRWQCFYIFGGVDSDELNNIAHIARRKFMIISK